MSPRSSDREKEGEPFREESFPDESEEDAKEEPPRNAGPNAGSRFLRETEDFTLDSLPSAQDSESVPGDIEETPTEAPLSPPVSRGSSTAESRRSSSPTSGGSTLSYDDLTPGSVGLFSAPINNLHDAYPKTSQYKEKLVCRDCLTVDKRELVGERAEGKLHEIRKKITPLSSTRNEDVPPCCVSPVATPGRDLHRLKTKISLSSDKATPSEVHHLDESDFGEWRTPLRHFEATRQNSHHAGDDDEPPTVPHDFTPAPSPEQAAGLLSRLTFWWITGLMKTGWKNPLEIPDLPCLPDSDDADVVQRKFLKVWDAERQLPEPALLKVLFRAFWPKLLLAAFLQLISILLQFTPPIFLNCLLTSIQGTATNNFMYRIFGKHYGFFTAGAFLVVPSFRSLTDNAILQIMFRLGMNVKTALVKTVYQKSINLSNSARQSRSVGEIVILMQVDSEKVNGAFPFLQTMWSAIVQVIGNIGLLLFYMGWSSMVGVSFLLITIPLQGKIVKQMLKIQKLILKNSGKRVKVVNEVFQGIRVVKAYAWEESFCTTVNGVRAIELKFMRSRVFLRALQTSVMLATPVLIMVISFSIFSGVQKKAMTAATVFTSLSLFNSLRQPLMMYPFVMNGVLTGYVSLKRLSRFMQSEEVQPVQRGPITENNVVLDVEKSKFQWVPGSIGGRGKIRPSSTNGLEAKTRQEDGGNISQDAPFSLEDISLTVRRGQLVAIVGPVGSGKSSLAAAFLGDMQQISGPKFTARGTLAYCAQQAWIMNASLKDNILFGHEYDDGRYKAVLSACALSADLTSLSDGDLTEIGERGINLSGGQKQRVSLARAVYADLDVYLLDDPLSAVDAQVGAHLFTKCIAGFLSDKTRIFITNQLQFVPSVDHIVVLKDGNIAEQGTYQELVVKDGEFSRLMQESGIRSDEEVDDEVQTPDTRCPGSPCSDVGKRPRRIKHSMRDHYYSRKGTLVEEEHRTRGTLQLSVYKKYWTEASSIIPFCVLAFYCAVQATDAFNRYWLAYWTYNHYHQPLSFYLGIYAALGVFFTALLFFRMLSQLMLCLWTAKLLHESVLESVMHAPMSFFDTTPVGRILNRFSADQQAVDETLPFSWMSFLNILFQAFSTIIVVSLVTPFFIIIFLPTGVLYAFIQQVYRRTARELKRLGSLSISPIYQQFTETLNGLATIRAYQQEDYFMEMCAGKLNVNNRAYMLLQSSNRWLSVRLEFMGNLMVFAAAMLAVGKKGTLYAGFAGISIDYAMQITASLNMLVRTMTDTENQMNAVERMLEYRHRVLPEGPVLPDQLKPHRNWPRKGAIAFEDLSMRYRPGLPLVLSGVSINVDGGEVVGIVGRTGSGKSSMMLCLFRLVEPASGCIKIDGLDIGKISLKDLRSRLSIIPQDPILFSGTIRTNIDPFNAFMDEDVWEVLERSHLKDKVQNSPGKLDGRIAEYGENWSVGERQLLCLARVLLRNCKILVMDEATSSVDFETDRLIQNTIRSYLQGATMLIIAHRINTIIDASRVLVLSSGKAVEYDKPSMLLNRRDSSFSMLVKDTGEANAEHMYKLASINTAFFTPK
ncbi:unnamed protein product [Calypogeia fissa]